MEFLKKIFKGELGYKTLLAAAVMFVVVILQGIGTIDADTADTVYKIAGSLGLVGLRDAQSKLPK